MLTVFILSVPQEHPRYQIAGALAKQLADCGARGGYQIQFTIPMRLWITSNYTDSDLEARQHGKYKADTWGSWSMVGVRDKVRNKLQTLLADQWQHNSYTGYEQYVALAFISYPPSVRQADPDNAAETVNTILAAGQQCHAIRGMSQQYLKALTFARLENHATPSVYKVRLFIMPAPKEFQISQALSLSVQAAWRAHAQH